MARREIFDYSQSLIILREQVLRGTLFVSGMSEVL